MRAVETTSIGGEHLVNDWRGNIKLLLLIFCLEPSFSALGYIAGNSDAGIFYGSALEVAVLLSVLIYRYPIIVLFIVSYSLSRLFGFWDYEGGKMYVLAYLKTLLAAVLFANLGPPSADDVKQINAVAYVVFVGVCLLQLISLLMLGRLNFEINYEADGKEKNGFLISHAFGYYMALFSLMFWNFGRKINSVLSAFLCVALGRRTTLVFVAINVFRQFYSKLSGLRKTLLALLVCAIGVYFFMERKSDFGAVFQDNAETNNFTSGRSKLWFDYLDDIQRGTFSDKVMMFGNGPFTSVKYNLKNSIGVWMHNDFFDILFCFGYVGLVVYLVPMLIVSRQLGLPFFLFFFFAATVNGFFMYCSVQIMFSFWAVNKLRS